MICFELKRNSKKRESLAFATLDTIYDTNTKARKQVFYKGGRGGGVFRES